jgi:hypothetical protein
MLSHDLVFGIHRWKITALELYLFTSKSEIWRDSTTHCADEQLDSGTWYVHHRGRCPRVRPPNYSGIDITAGSRYDVIYAGLLIRELDQRDGSATPFKTIVRGQCGPRNNHDKWTSDDRNLIAGIHQKDIKSGPLRLEPITTARECPLWIGPRKLNPKNPEDKKFAPAALRLATSRTKLLSTRMNLVG